MSELGAGVGTIDVRLPEGGYIDSINDLPDAPFGLRMAQDGQRILVPQPSDHPNDPLQWSAKKKYKILFIITLASCLGDFGSSIGIPAIVSQALEFRVSEQQVQQSLAGNIFALGAGGFIGVPLSEHFGRAPIFVIFALLTTGTAAWSAAAVSYPSYLASRVLYGVFSGLAQSGALMWIQEMFFYHEHARTMNLWNGPVVVAPYMGPMIASFIISGATWRWAFWLVTILHGLCVVLSVFFLDEPFFDRALKKSERPPPQARWKNLLGTAQWRSSNSRPGLIVAFTRPFRIVTKIPFLVTLFWGYVSYAWLIGVNTTSAIWLSGIYHFTALDLGFFYFSALVGVALAMAVGHWSHDAVAHAWAKRHHGVIHPEARLILSYPPSILMAISLVILGFVLERHWHFMLIAVFYGAQVGGLTVAVTALSTYLIDAYPEAAMETGMWFGFVRTAGGFMSSYIQLHWVQNQGASTVLGIQAAIQMLSVALLVFLQVRGKAIRTRQGPMKFD